MLFVNSKGFYTGFPVKTEEGKIDFHIMAVPREDEMLFDPRLWNSFT